MIIYSALETLYLIMDSVRFSRENTQFAFLSSLSIHNYISLCFFHFFNQYNANMDIPLKSM